jgi:hypothetical protein
MSCLFTRDYAKVNWNDYDQKDNIFSNEMKKRIPYLETFISVPSETPSGTQPSVGQTYPPFYTNPKKIPKNIDTINEIQTDLLETQDQISNNYIDLSQNIGTYLSHTQYLSKNNDKYHYSDDQDPNVIIGHIEPKDLKTGLINDINEMKLYENAIYVTSVIAGATFLIAAIILSKK